MCRKCKYCDNPAKKNITSEGRNKGYYRTCGSDKCKREQYKNKDINSKKGKLKIKRIISCELCKNEFTSESGNHKRWCKECAPDEKWRRRVQRYGVGKKQWDQKLKDQNYKCCLCNNLPEVVDHDHKTGKVRGLLCYTCNYIVTGIEKGDEWIKKAKDYINY